MSIKKGLQRQCGYISGNLRVLQRLNEYEFAVELKMLRDGVNENKWDFQNIAENYKTFIGSPLLIAYVGNRVGDGHNADQAMDANTGKRYRSYMSATAERIVGTISDDENDLYLERDAEGRTWVIAKGKLWTVYAPELVEKITRQERMSVSVEVNVKQSYQDGDVEVFTKWEGLGVTILGDGVAPAVPGANIRRLAAMEEEFMEMKLKIAALTQPMQGTAGRKTTTKKGVKKRMFTNKTLAKTLQAKFPDHKVIGYSEDGKNVCLMAKDGTDTFKYTFDEENTVNAENIKPAALSCDVSFGENCTVELSLADICGGTMGEIKALEVQLTEEQKRNAQLAQKIADMAAAETERRKKASHAAALRQLAEINANREESEQISEAEIKDVCDAADKGDYCECEDADGSWCGEEKACAAVRDIAMKKQMALDRAKTEKRKEASRKVYAFESAVHTESKQGLEGLYARTTK